MEERIAIVTGGASGIGKAIAEGLIDDGYTVVVCGRTEERGKALEAKHPDRIAFFRCDVSVEGNVRDVVAFTWEKFGRIDALVNNAGIIRRRRGEAVDPVDWDAVFAVNVRGAFLFCKYVADRMKKQRKGRIVNISSIAAKLGDITSAIGYGPSKAALDALTKSFARELAPYGVTVNAVAPHAIETEMSAEWSDETRRRILSGIPLGRLGRPFEVAAAVRFLLSEGAGFITGEILDVNGGYAMD